MHSAGKGRLGEQYAARLLEKAGMCVLASNFRSPMGEVDLIAQDRGTLVFVEVKSWNSRGIADLEYGINREKQRRIIETAKYFLAGHRKYNEMAIRFDVVFIGKTPLPSPKTAAPVIRHLASAFVECV
ncbi:MAG: YraN family protein [Treponema sp.]|jgi:putative endonuclease|nr:YraN family protein [Treponema sp.]